MNSNDRQLSKSLSWLLRHGAENQGLKLKADGYLCTDEILKLRQFRGYNLSDIIRVVETNDKKRFSIRKNERGIIEIRANQGHSIKAIDDNELLRPLMNPEDCPSNVIHGTYLKNWESIKTQGLSRMNRNHIHFAKDVPNTGVISGMRQNCDVYIYLNVEKALKDGLKLYESQNGVILSPGNETGFITPEYFLKVVNNKG